MLKLICQQLNLNYLGAMPIGKTIELDGKPFSCSGPPTR